MKYLALISLLLTLFAGPVAAQEEVTEPAAQEPATEQATQEPVDAVPEEAPEPLGFSTHPEAEPHYRKALGLVDDYRGLTVAGVKTAKEEFQKGLAYEPDNPLAQLMWARVTLRLTNYELSVEGVEKIENEAREILDNLDLSGENALTIRKERASVYLYELIDLEKAEADLTHLAAHAPETDVMVALGEMYFHQEKYFAAKQSFEKALALDPGNIEAHNNIGWCEYRNGNLDEAATHFTAAIDQDPKRMGSILGMAKIHQDRGEYGEAIDRYNQLLDISPNFVYFLDLMILYFKHYSFVFYFLGLIILGIFGRSLIQTLKRDRERAAKSAQIARDHAARQSGGDA